MRQESQAGISNGISFLTTSGGRFHLPGLGVGSFLGAEVGDGVWGPAGLTFQIFASLPYTTAILLALPSLMSCFSVSLSSSDTKPMKELSGV